MMQFQQQRGRIPAVLWCLVPAPACAGMAFPCFGDPLRGVPCLGSAYAGHPNSQRCLQPRVWTPAPLRGLPAFRLSLPPQDPSGSSP